MTKLLYSATMSLDGFIAGPGGDMQWLAKHLAEPNPEAAALMEDIGALLVGANTNSGDDPNAGTNKEGAFGGEYSGPVIVLTHKPPERVDEGEAADQATRYATDLRAAVALSKQLAGDSRYVNVLGAAVARQLIEAGELDEVLDVRRPCSAGRRSTDVRARGRERGQPAAARCLGDAHPLFEILRD